MFQSSKNELPLIKHRKNNNSIILSVDNIEQSAARIKSYSTGKWKRKLSYQLNSDEKCWENSSGTFFQKKLLIHKKLSALPLLKTQKFSNQNTNDISRTSQQLIFFEKLSKKLISGDLQGLKLVNFSENPSFRIKVNSIKTEQKPNFQSDNNKKHSNKKYSCLVERHIFEKKPKLNKSQEKKLTQRKESKVFLNEDSAFWKTVNESIIECQEQNSTNELSKQLFTLVNDILV